MNVINKYLSLIGLIIIAMLFTGCAKKETMYYWADYQNNLYSYYQLDKSSFEEQTISIEHIVEKAKSSGKPVPPGLHAHLGLLYANTGQQDKALEQFQIEETLFPESTNFIKFIQQKYQGKK